jgi:hypothetical protein
LVVNTLNSYTILSSTDPKLQLFKYHEQIRVLGFELLGSFNLLPRNLKISFELMVWKFHHLSLDSA